MRLPYPISCHADPCGVVSKAVMTLTQTGQGRNELLMTHLPGTAPTYAQSSSSHLPCEARSTSMDHPDLLGQEKNMFLIISCFQNPRPLFRRQLLVPGGTLSNLSPLFSHEYCVQTEWTRLTPCIN